MTAFLREIVFWAWTTALHFSLMFWWIWLAAVVVTVWAECHALERLHRWSLDRPDDGWRTVRRAVLMGVLSPPSRSKIFRRAHGLLAGGVSPCGVVAYLVSAQSLLVWLLFVVVALSGPQPAIGQFVAVAVMIAVLARGVGTLPVVDWQAARDRASRPIAGDPPPGAGRGRLLGRWSASVLGQARSLAGPVAYGLVGVGFFLALGQSSAYVSLQASRGPAMQLANAGAGLLLAFLTGAPLVGNAFFAAALWKAEFVTYAGLVAFYLGTIVMPLTGPRYEALLGADLVRRLRGWVVIAIVAGALAATAWWWGLDGIAGGLGAREWFERATASTLRPNDVPWFHHWFAPGI